MAIYHLEHSYLNWRAILCKKNDLYLCGFSSFSQHFFLLDSLDFHLDSTRIFQVHDMTINFSSFFCLLRATTYAIDGLPSWGISSHMRIVLKGWAFGPRLFISFLSTKRVMAQKCFRGMGNFQLTCLKALVRMISVYHDLGFCFAHWKGLANLNWQVWSCSKSWCIPNYQLSVPTKIYLFVCLIFEEFEKWVSKSGVLWPIA